MIKLAPAEASLLCFTALYIDRVPYSSYFTKDCPLVLYSKNGYFCHSQTPCHHFGHRFKAFKQNDIRIKFDNKN